MAYQSLIYKNKVYIMTTISLLVIAVIILTGGTAYYFMEAKKLAKEFKEFMLVTFEALKDKKITIAEKELMLKEFADMKPYAQKIKSMFLDDTKELMDDLKEFYDKAKEAIKK